MLKRGMLLRLWFCCASSLVVAAWGPAWGQSPAQLVNGNRTHAGATNYGVTTGTTNTYILTLNKPIPGYADGSCYLLELHAANTGPATLNVNGKGAKSIFKYVSGVSTPLAANDFGVGQVVEVCYDGMNMQAQLGGGGGGPSGSGDASTNTNVSVDNELALFSGTSGKLLKRAPTSGIPKLTAGVLGPAVAGTDYVLPSGTTAFAGALTTNPSPCNTPTFVRDSAADGTLTCVQVQFSELGGTAADAQIPHLNTLSTGLTLGRCVETDGATGMLVSTAGPCGAAAGLGDIGEVGTCFTGECFTATTPSHSLFYSAMTAPVPPQPGSGVMYMDGASKNMALKDDAGVVKHGVQTTLATANDFLTAIAATGQVSKARPSLANLSDNADILTAASNHEVTNKFTVPTELPRPISANAITPDCNTHAVNTVTGIAAPLTVNAPVCTGPKPYSSQDLTLRFFGNTGAYAVTWNAVFVFTDGIPQPTVITGNGIQYNQIMFRYNSVTSKWAAIASTFPAGTPAYANLPLTGIKMHATKPTGPTVANPTTVIWFDDTTQECILWEWTIPGDYLGSPVMRLWYAMLSDTITSHSANFDVQVWALKAGQDVQTPGGSFDSINNCDDANIPGTLGTWNDIGCALTNFDGAVANDPVEFQICSDVTPPLGVRWVGDLGLIRARFEYQK